MRWAIILLAILLTTATSAETVSFVGYNWTFDINRQHSIDEGTIRTNFGSIYFIAPPMSASFDDSRYMRSIKSLDRIYDIYYLAPNDYIALDSYAAIANGKRLGIGIESSMNLTDIVDFLKTLKVQRAK